MSKDKFQIFLEVLKECNIQTNYDFAHFMSVIGEHCIQKGITDYDKIKEVWLNHNMGLQQIVNNLKNKANEEERRA